MENAYDHADSVTTALTLSGKLDSKVNTATKLGTITVTIGEKQVVLKNINFDSAARATIGQTEIYAEEDMTWGEWLNSPYKVEGFQADDTNTYVEFSNSKGDYRMYRGNLNLTPIYIKLTAPVFLKTEVTYKLQAINK